MENPIIDNRIVSDHTFAIRLLSFFKDVKCADACGEEEKDYFLIVSKELLKYQIETATSKDEADYLNRINARSRVL